jgi:thiosulfate/3-mercaptopyruvate sulfurtransferase
MGGLVSTAWLADRLGPPAVVVVDASWHLPSSKRSAHSEFTAAHIPGAQFYDLDAGAATDTPLPHMLPPPGKFAADMAAMGIGNGSTVVVYDSVGLFSAARLWWMLRVFGHDNSFVLDGGLPKWRAEGRATETGPARAFAQGRFEAVLHSQRVRTLSDVSAALTDGQTQLADARSPSRFRGEEPEPRPGVRPGHMPGSLNVHYASLLNADGTLKTGALLREAFQSRGVDLDKPIITTCGSGVTAAILSLALHELGLDAHSLYDGSWAEWGASQEPLATG